MYRPTFPLISIPFHLRIRIIAVVKAWTMKPKIRPRTLCYQLSVFFSALRPIYQPIKLKDFEEVGTENNVANLLTEWLCQTSVNLRCTYNMFPLLSLLWHLNHYFNVNILTFQTVKLKMYFINKINNAGIAIFQSLKTVKSVILYYFCTFRLAMNINVTT